MVWMRKWTKTQDEHDIANQYKPFPDFRCFDALHDLFLKEDKLFLKKSRTVMATWWGCGECLHYVMTHQPASCIFWCPDQDRAEVCIRYCKILCAQQDPELKRLYPLPRKKKTPEDQAVYKFELAGGGWLEALPGKNPDKIRSQHPTIVFMDEAAFNPEGGAAYDNAVSTQPHKLVGVSSVKQGWFTDLLAPAIEVDSPWNHPGFSVSRIPPGKPGAGIAVAKLKYTAIPTMTPAKVAKLKSEYADKARCARELEMDETALSGEPWFPELDKEKHYRDFF